MQTSLFAVQNVFSLLQGLIDRLARHNGVNKQKSYNPPTADFRRRDVMALPQFTGIREVSFNHKYVKPSQPRTETLLGVGMCGGRNRVGVVSLVAKGNRVR